jgi:hypothetical protein
MPLSILINYNFLLPASENQLDWRAYSGTYQGYDNYGPSETDECVRSKRKARPNATVLLRMISSLT